MPLNIFREFIKLESASGAVLLIAAIIALCMANSPFSQFYFNLFNTSVAAQLGTFHITTTLSLIINDGLMALFFLLVSLEIKREFVEGELNSRAKALLPVIAAIGGMILPALIYIILNVNHPHALRGFGIPTATDIAFSLAVLSLLGKKIPETLKIFLTALAIIDDLGAIIIIALFYTYNISMIFLSLALACVLLLTLFNYMNVSSMGLYLLGGFLLWILTLKSGIHPTIAGVALGFILPVHRDTLAKKLEHLLHPWVAYGILPLFAFANAGLSFLDLHWRVLINPITLGIILGLFLGKQLGVFLTSLFAVKLKIAALPNHIRWHQLYGVALICGIGFTMSLFIGTLAFFDGDGSYTQLVRLGVLTGSFLSGIMGYIVLRFSKKPSGTMIQS